MFLTILLAMLNCAAGALLGKYGFEWLKSKRKAIASWSAALLSVGLTVYIAERSSQRLLQVVTSHERASALYNGTMSSFYTCLRSLNNALNEDGKSQNVPQELLQRMASCTSEGKDEVSIWMQEWLDVASNLHKQIHVVVPEEQIERISEELHDACKDAYNTAARGQTDSDWDDAQRVCVKLHRIDSHMWRVISKAVDRRIDKLMTE